MSSKSSIDDEMEFYQNWIKRLEKEIVTKTESSFVDVIGCQSVKAILKQNVLVPLKNPSLFENSSLFRRTFLFYGLPGTGKTFLAKALATECGIDFFYVHGIDLIARGFCRAETLIKGFFDLAEKRKPCLLFIDDIDEIFGENVVQDEYERQFRDEFLVQMQKIEKNWPSVLFFAASNRPWNLDRRFRRRIQKFVFIPLPNVEERTTFFKSQFDENVEGQWTKIAEQTENFSRSDLRVVCRDASLKPIRRILNSKHFKKIPNNKSDQPAFLWLSCSPADREAVEISSDQIPPDEFAEPPITANDLQESLNAQRVNINDEDLQMLMKFHDEFSSADENF